MKDWIKSLYLLLKRRVWLSSTITTALFSIAYVLIGNARSIHENPFIPGAVVAVNMVVPVVAGILFGWRVGFFVGLLGTLGNALSPAGSTFEYLSILPHALMGLSAGILKNYVPTPVAALALVVGHALNLAAYTLYGLVSSAVFQNPQFWDGLFYEIFIGIATITICSSIYRLSFTPSTSK